MEIARPLFVFQLLVLVLSSGLQINVTDSGKDDPDCLDGTSPCRSLSFVLSQRDTSINHTSIHVYSNQTFHNASGIYLSFLENVTIDGHSMTVTCTKLGAGLSFTNCTGIAFANLGWKDCCVRHPTSALIEGENIHSSLFKFPNAFSSIFLSNCTNFSIIKNRFESVYGSGLSLYNVRGKVLIENTIFANMRVAEGVKCTDPTSNQTCSLQSTGLYIEFSYCVPFNHKCRGDHSDFENSSYTIINCTFTGNQNLGAYENLTSQIFTDVPREDHWPFGYGGGLGVVVRPYKVRYLSLSVVNCTFTNNVAVYGGGMYLEFAPGYPDRNSITIKDSNFSTNNATHNGGGIQLVTDLQYAAPHPDVDSSFDNRLYIERVKFGSNVAEWGGGMNYLTHPTSAAFLDFQLRDSSWCGNKFSNGAGAVGLLCQPDTDQKLIFKVMVQFHNCNFSGTVLDRLPKSGFRTISHAIHSLSVPVGFHGSSVFANNSATALGLVDTIANFSGVVLFKNNTGVNGGAVFMDGISWIVLVHGVRINFTSNLAFGSGGALYYLSPPALRLSCVQACFIHYNPPWGTSSQSLTNVSVIFQENRAIQSGDAVYISEPDVCLLSNGSNLFDPKGTNSLFDYSGQNHHSNTLVIATSPTKLKIDGGLTLKHATDSGEFTRYSTMAGVPLNLTVNAVDGFSQKLSTFLHLNTLSIEDYNGNFFTEDYCSFNDSCQVSQHLMVSGVPVDDLRTMAPNNSEDILLVFQTSDPLPVFLPLQIEFAECELGFYYDSSVNSCKCIDEDYNASPLICYQDTLITQVTPCVRVNYWLGYLEADENVTVFHPCLPEKCRSDFNDDLKLCKKLSDYYILNNSHQVCKNNLTGLMCSSCNGQPGLALSYNSYGCYPCSTHNQIELVMLVILGCVVIVVVVVVFLKLNLHISTAGFYCFLYFYSVLPMFWIETSKFLDAVLTIVMDFTSLDFDILKYLKLCLFNDVRPIHYEFLHFVYPFLVILIIFAIIKLDKHCLRRCSIFSGNSSVQALCIILLISYTSISKTALMILLPLLYENVNITDTRKIHWYVYADPGVKYLDYHDHLPFWIFAALAELFLVFPFALGMLFAPWLMQHVNMARIWPILDEYQACFRDHFRWFPGVYLVARQVLLLIFLVVRTPEAIAYLQQIFCLALVILIATLQPYQERWINCIDTLFLALLALLSFSTNNPTAEKIFRNQSSLQTAVIAILTLTPVTIMLLGICAKLCCAMYQRYVKFKAAKKVLTMNPNLYYDHQDPHSTDCPSEKENPGGCTSSKSFDDPPPRFYEQERKERARMEESSEDSNDEFMTEDSSLLGSKSQTRSHGIWRRMVPTDSSSFSNPSCKLATKPASKPVSPPTWSTD